MIKCKNSCPKGKFEGCCVQCPERETCSDVCEQAVNYQDCADAIQESIVKAFSKIHTLKKDRYAKTWLIRILINECYNITRQSGMKEQWDESYAEAMILHEEHHDYSELYKAVNNLKEDLRVPVVLYYMEEFSVKEVARILDISEGAVQKRLARARAKLKKVVHLEEIFI